MAALRELGQGLIDPKYCCCAIPLVNFGIYAVLTEQLLVGIAAGALAVWTPRVVGTSFPTFTVYLFAILCWVVAALQPLGFIGVLREKTKTFRVFAWINIAAVISVFVTAAALIAVSATRHTTAVNSCVTNFFTASSTASATAASMLAQQGPLLCSAFAWADIGLMGGLWLLMLIVQSYFLYLTRTYSTSQVSDHKLYHSVYSENPEAFTLSILHSKRYNPNSIYSQTPSALGPNRARGAGMGEDAWDARMSVDDANMRHQEELAEWRNSQAMAAGSSYEGRPGAGAHRRGESHASDVRFDDGYHAGAGAGAGPMGGAGYGYDQSNQYAQNSGQQYLPSHNHGGQAYGYGYGSGSGGGQYVEQMPEARYGRDPGPTPTLNHYSNGEGVGFAGAGPGLSRPGAVQSHPGMFGRKSPRGYQ